MQTHKIKYINEYNRNKYKGLSIRLSLENDADVIERLKQIPNLTRYIAGLVREDIQRAKKYQELEEIVDYQAIHVKRWPYELVDEIIPGSVWYSVGYGSDLDEIRLLMMNYVEQTENTGVLHTIRRFYDPDMHVVAGEDLSRRSR